MNNNFREIHIGKMIGIKFKENNIVMERACKFFNCSENEIEEYFLKESIESSLLLKWSKLLEYDFFRIYSQHLQLYAPPASTHKVKSVLPKFRKNIYTNELIEFILELIATNQKTRGQVIKEYRIPKTTLYKWIEKYGNKEA